jgi:hypothetical protein
MTMLQTTVRLSGGLHVHHLFLLLSLPMDIGFLNPELLAALHILVFSAWLMTATV